MEPLLTFLIQELTRINAPVTAYFSDGASDAAIRDAEEKLGFTLPADVKTLYQWRDGTQVGQDLPFKAHFISSGGYFVALEEAIETYEYTVKENKDFREKLLQLLSDGQGNYILTDCDPKSKEYGKILIYDLYTVEVNGTGLTAIYDSLPSFLETIVQCYRQDIYAFKALITDEEENEEGAQRAGFASKEDYNQFLDYDEDREVILRTDEGKEAALSKKLNPASPYWKNK